MAQRRRAMSADTSHYSAGYFELYSVLSAPIFWLSLLLHTMMANCLLAESRLFYYFVVFPSGTTDEYRAAIAFIDKGFFIMQVRYHLKLTQRLISKE